MAEIAQVRTVLAVAAEALGGGSAAAGLPERTLAIEVLDHDVVFRGRLVAGRIVDVVEHDAATLTAPDLTPAAVTLAATSDVLVQVLTGQLTFPHAWASGQVRVQASLKDLWTLRRLVS